MVNKLGNINTSSGGNREPMILENGIPIKNNTKSGYLVAKDGDGVDVSSRMEHHRGTVQKGMSHTLTTSCDSGVCISTKGKKLDVAKTILAGYEKSNMTGFNEDNAVLQNYRIRKLTPKECFRLMGVKDEDYEKLTVSNTQKYKQAGNSIVVDVLMAIFENMFINECETNTLF